MPRFFKPLLFSTILAASSICAASPAFAQANTNRVIIDRMDRIERDLQTIQRQNARGSNTNLETMGSNDGDSNPAVMGIVDGDIQQQITMLQEELRNLRGQLEKNDFENRKNAEAIERMQKDVDYRLNALEQTPAMEPAAAPLQESEPEPVAEAPPMIDAESIKKNGSSRKIIVQQVKEPEPVIDTTTEAVATETPDVSTKATSAGDGTLNIEPKSNEDPREHYNRAFRLLNQTRYDEAGKAFQNFTKKYPDDPLIGNAYYWLGETRYIQRDYNKAADSFREGFEVLPNGPKAPDNLLKLAMTLRALNRNDDACVVLGQIKVKFKDSSTSLLEKAEQERTRIGCK